MPLLRRFWDNPYLLLVLTTLLWGGNAVAGRLAVGHIAPMMLTSMRWICVAAILPFFVRRELVAYWPQLKAHAGLIVFMGVFGYTAFNSLMYLAAYSTSAINIGIVQGSIPVFVLIGAFILYRTPIGRLQIAGVVLTVVGVMLIASRGDLAVLRSLAFAYGDLLMIAACGFYAAYTIALRRRPAIPGLVFFAAMAIVACVISLPLFAAEIGSGGAFWPTPRGWLILIFVALGPSLFSQLFFMRGVELIGPGRAGVFVNLVPVFASVLAVAIIGEPFAWYHAAALALVLGGIWLAERSGRR